jgi:sulfite exporter TauE/SafE
MSLGALFVLGLLTSVHCAAMCGGINLSQTVGRSGIAPSLLYNLGRVVSYTLIGAVVGAIGAAVSFTPITQGVLKLAAGVLMLLMGVNMLCILPFKISLPSLNLKSRSTAPLIVGLLNGLMPCGPLQSMQIYALSTGNALSGALAMLVFSAGTVPLMFGIGAIGNIFKRSMSRAMTVGAVLVCVMGLSMLTQGVTLSNIGGSVSVKPSAASEPRASDGVQIVESTLPVRGYPNISVSKGIPAEWTISVPDGRLNGCNYAMYIPEYGVEWQFDYGDNLIEFTPLNAGKFTYYCWMGMQRGTITVTDGGA